MNRSTPAQTIAVNAGVRALTFLGYTGYSIRIASPLVINADNSHTPMRVSQHAFC